MSEKPQTRNEIAAESTRHYRQHVYAVRNENRAKQISGEARREMILANELGNEEREVTAYRRFNTADRDIHAARDMGAKAIQAATKHYALNKDALHEYAAIEASNDGYEPNLKEPIVIGNQVEVPPAAAAPQQPQPEHPTKVNYPAGYGLGPKS